MKQSDAPDLDLQNESPSAPLEDIEGVEELNTESSQGDNETAEPVEEVQSEKKTSTSTDVDEADGNADVSQREDTLDDLVDESSATAVPQPTGDRPVSETINDEDDLELHHVTSQNAAVPPSQSSVPPSLRSEKNKFFPYATEEKPKKRFPLTILLILVLVGVVGGVVYLLKYSSYSPLSVSPLASASPSNSSTTTPQPTASPLDRSQYTIRVLNGTLTSGLAGSVSAQLKNLGYKTAPIGNATNSAFTRTVVRSKPNEPSGLISQLISDLAPEYSAIPSTPLSSNDSVDAEVIIGQK